MVNYNIFRSCLTLFCMYPILSKYPWTGWTHQQVSSHRLIENNPKIVKCIPKLGEKFSTKVHVFRTCIRFRTNRWIFFLFCILLLFLIGEFIKMKLGYFDFWGCAAVPFQISVVLKNVQILQQINNGQCTTEHRRSSVLPPSPCNVPWVRDYHGPPNCVKVDVGFTILMKNSRTVNEWVASLPIYQPWTKAMYTFVSHNELCGLKVRYARFLRFFILKKICGILFWHFFVIMPQIGIQFFWKMATLTIVTNYIGLKSIEPPITTVRCQ